MPTAKCIFRRTDFLSLRAMLSVSTLVDERPTPQKPSIYKVSPSHGRTLANSVLIINVKMWTADVTVSSAENVPKTFPLLTGNESVKQKAGNFPKKWKPRSVCRPGHDLIDKAQKRGFLRGTQGDEKF